jgi:hypothetical protein
MTRTEERLTDALDAAARAMPEDDMRPLIVPVQRSRRLAWAAPVASAAGLLLVVGLAVVVAGHLPGSGQINSGPPPPHPYYVVADRNGDLPQVRSTATGTVTDTLSVPHVRNPQEPALVAAIGNVFFAALAQRTGEALYRFRLTATGQITALSNLLPGEGVLASSDWDVHAMAASPDGRWLAFALTDTKAGCSSPNNSGCFFSSSGPDALFMPGQSDNVAIVNTSTGARSAWYAALPDGTDTFNVLSLSWSANSQALRFIVRQCPPHITNAETCSPTGKDSGGSTSIWELNGPFRPGPLQIARSLHSLAGFFDFVPQALLSPDGITITDVIPPQVGGPIRAGDAYLVVEQSNTVTGKSLRGLYIRNVGPMSSVTANNTPYAALSTDSTGQHWLLGVTYCDRGRCAGGFNGWIDDGKLVPLPPGNGAVASEAW